ncbi:MAG: HslU--HslV peptidase ATPase subunit, partial [Methylophagaceae bacterium]
DALGADEFVRILTEPDASLTEQYIALLNTEGSKLSFSEDGLQRIAELAFQVNEQTENIGARRLHTLLEKLLEEISFNTSEDGATDITIDADYVNQQLSILVEDEDLSRYIL